MGDSTSIAWLRITHWCLSIFYLSLTISLFMETPPKGVARTETSPAFLVLLLPLSTLNPLFLFLVIQISIHNVTDHTTLFLLWTIICFPGRSQDGQCSRRYLTSTVTTECLRENQQSQGGWRESIWEWVWHCVSYGNSQSLTLPQYCIVCVDNFISPTLSPLWELPPMRWPWQTSPAFPVFNLVKLSEE